MGNLEPSTIAAPMVLLIDLAHLTGDRSVTMNLTSGSAAYPSRALGPT